MIIQIFGTKKCKDTQKAIRFFKERGVKTQFIDLNIKGVSPGELKSISRSIPVDDLIDRESKLYEKKNMKYIVHGIEDELLKDPLLFKTPIVRRGQESSVGNKPEIWKMWLEAEK